MANTLASQSLLGSATCTDEESSWGKATESFVNTFKRDYVSQMDRSSAAIVLRQMPAAFDHFNEIHPHSALGYKSPRMYRKELTRRAQIGTN